MDILLDARLLHRPLSGLERVQRNLIQALAREPEVDRLRVLVKPGTEIPAALRGAMEPVEVHSTEAILAILTDPSQRPDVYHLTWFPDATPRDLWLPIAAPASVVQVHDAILNRHPEYFPSPAAWEWYHGFCKELVLHADALLCHSESVADEIERDLDGDRSRAVVAPLAVEPTLRDALDEAQVRARLGALGIGEGDYFLMVGKDYPHKDHATAFRALGRVNAERDTPARIVIAGNKIWKDGASTDAVLRSSRVEAQVSWHQGLTDDEVKALLQGARALLYPSLEEGFGLPPIEAMALGTPVLAARSMSIPEVCGDGADLFDPGDDAALAAQMLRVLEGGPQIAELVERGRHRESGYEWSRTAQGAITCYRNAIAAARERPTHLSRGEVLDILRTSSTSQIDDAKLLAAWQERCLSVESRLEAARTHIGSLEAKLAEAQIATPEAPDLTPPPPMDTGPRRPRWSLRRRLRKIRDGLRR